MVQKQYIPHFKAFLITMNIEMTEDTGHSSITMDVAIQTQEKEKKKEKMNLKPKFMAPVINFTALWNEWKSEPKKQEIEMTDLNTKSTQTKRSKKKWMKDAIKTNWFKMAVISFALLISSTYDVVSDGLLAESFINGENYTKYTKYERESKLQGR